MVKYLPFQSQFTNLMLKKKEALNRITNSKLKNEKLHFKVSLKSFFQTIDTRDFFNKIKYHTIHSYLKRIKASWNSCLKIWVRLSVGIAYDHEIIQQNQTLLYCLFKKILQYLVFF